MMDRVNAEPVNTAIQPKSHDVQHRLTNLRVPPVQIRLLLEVCVIIELPRSGIEGPSRPAELGEPIGRGRAIVPRIAPDVPIAFGILSGRSAFEEPTMLVG